jgi:hypothetical protein
MSNLTETLFGVTIPAQSNHTPGPWRIEPHNKERGKSWDYLVWKEGHLPNIGIVFYQGSTLTPEGEAETFHNARLIAAAPALLESLRAILPVFDNDGAAQYRKVYSREIAAAESAIAKAEGRDAP